MPVLVCNFFLGALRYGGSQIFLNSVGLQSSFHAVVCDGCAAWSQEVTSCAIQVDCCRAPMLDRLQAMLPVVSACDVWGFTILCKSYHPFFGRNYSGLQMHQ